jgi:hypothetical protein
MESLVLSLPDANAADIGRAKDLIWETFQGALGQVRPPPPTPGEMGYPGHGDGWSGAGLRQAVLADAFQHAVLDRLEGLRLRAGANQPVTPLVRANVRDFVRERILRHHILRMGDASGDAVLRVVALVGEWFLASLRELGLHRLPPAHLGYAAGGDWRGGDCLHDALIDCYTFAILDRAVGLGAAAANGQRVAKLVRINARRFIASRMMAHDPMGHRAYQVTVGAVQSLRGLGFLSDSGRGRAWLARFTGTSPAVPPATRHALRSYLINRPGWPLARLDFLGRRRAAQGWAEGMVRGMPGSGIAAFLVMELVEELRDALGDWLRPIRVDPEDPGPGPADPPGGDGIWAIADRDCVLGRVGSHKNSEILGRMVEYLEGLPAGDALLFAEMARALGRTPQALQYYVPHLRAILEECRGEP